ncbi:MAG: 50S ribosomal protein L18 [Candidatus Magasanikbacteria bacterium]|nr:50S ribosomal protein L18 [Candidatus Magasanikbacteria bacterium]
MKRSVTTTSRTRRTTRHARVRARVMGTASCPRLSVFRSHKGVIAQLIDDEAKKTLAYVASAKLKSEPVEGKTGKTALSFQVGKVIAVLAEKKGVTKVVFDRGGYAYHGRVAAIADGARAGGLKF